MMTMRGNFMFGIQRQFYQILKHFVAWGIILPPHQRLMYWLSEVEDMVANSQVMF